MKSDFDAYFSDAWFEEVDRLVQRYSSEHEITYRDLNPPRPIERAEILYRSSVQFRQKLWAWKSRVDDDQLDLSSGAHPDLPEKFYHVMQWAKTHPRYESDLDFLLDRGIPIPELIDRIYRGGLFLSPPRTGRPAGKRQRSGFGYGEKLRYAACAVRMLIDRTVIDRNAALQRITATVFDADGKRGSRPGPATPDAFRRALAPLLDQVLWRLEARRYRLRQKRGANFPP